VFPPYHRWRCEGIGAPCKQWLGLLLVLGGLEHVVACGGKSEANRERPLSSRDSAPDPNHINGKQTCYARVGNALDPVACKDHPGICASAGQCSSNGHGLESSASHVLPNAFAGTIS
jgi:hypothetical protein